MNLILPVKACAYAGLQDIPPGAVLNELPGKETTAVLSISEWNTKVDSLASGLVGIEKPLNWLLRFIGESFSDHLSSGIPIKSYTLAKPHMDFIIRCMNHKGIEFMQDNFGDSVLDVDKEARCLVFANITMDLESRGRGLMTALLSHLHTAAHSVQNLRIIKFESVFNKRFAAHLQSAGYLPDQSGAVGCSWYKSIH